MLAGNTDAEHVNYGYDGNGQTNLEVGQDGFVGCLKVEGGYLQRQRKGYGREEAKQIHFAVHATLKELNVDHRVGRESPRHEGQDCVLPSTGEGCYVTNLRQKYEYQLELAILPPPISRFEPKKFKKNQ